ncbi:MAG TPA: UvrD-helicase domain-containing protein [Fimbriimonadales bacterium]|nr:UvrD-helicase domain-containing protein [Fimbriimonadales bacterium]
MDLIQEQIIAIGESGKKVAIIACAGAGKTTVLIERYIKTIEEGTSSPERILAITYTRKAAAEMKMRIVQALRQKGRHHEAQLAQVGPISTVHSYCERLLREYPFEAGLDPGFNVLTEGRAEDLLISCAQRTLHRYRNKSPEIELVLQKYSGKKSRKYDESNMGKLVEHIGDIVQAMRTAGVKLEYLLENLQRHEDTTSVWKAMCAHWLENHIPEEMHPELRKQWLDAPWCEFQETFQTTLRLNKRNVPQSLTQPVDISKEEETAKLSFGLLELSVACWEEYLDELKKQRALDFSELEYRARNLLEKSPEVLRDKYDHVMVDEAQDLNPLQHGILEQTPAKTILFVGDPQQAIYGFRGAERELFKQWAKDANLRKLNTNWRSHQKIIRTVTSVFAPIWEPNGEFIEMLPSPKTESVISESDDPFVTESSNDNPPVEIWRIPHQKPDVITQGILQLLSEGIEKKQIAVLARNRADVEKIASGMSRAKLPFAVLDSGRNYFLRMEIYDLASVLKALAIPTDDVAMLSVLRSPLVGLSLDSIVLLGLEAKATKKSVWELLHETPFDFPEIECEMIREFLGWFDSLSAVADRLPAWQILADVFTATNLDARLARTRGGNFPILIANARQLLKIAGEQPDMDALQFSRWIETRQQIKTPWSDAPTFSEDADAVKLLSIHKAKGLEWDVVIVYAFASTPSTKDSDLIINKKFPVPIPAFDGYFPLAYRVAFDLRNKAEFEEEIRLLYVAMTRARKRLILAVPDLTKAHKTVNRWQKLLSRLVKSSEIITRDFPLEIATETKVI